MKKLILFDIDGTLCLTGGAGGRAMWHAFGDTFGGSNGDEGSIAMAGRTDSWIVAQMAAQLGRPYDERLLTRFRETYLVHLAREIHLPGPQKGVLPGVREVLETLSRNRHAHLALLTGNFHRGAEIKLTYFDLWRYFQGGAFGDDAQDRNRLLAIALDRVREHDGHTFRPEDVVVVGDTPLDVAVAVAGGARSLAVATGNYDEEALRESGADVVLNDLSDGEAVLRGLGLTSGPD